MGRYGLDGETPDIGRDVYIAPGAHVIGRVALHDRASVWFNAVVRGDNDPIRIGMDSNVQDGAMIHSDPGVPTTIGDGVTIGHHAIVHGATASGSPAAVMMAWPPPGIAEPRTVSRNFALV